MSVADSVATSAVSIESTQHLRQRKAERGVDTREMQLAVKHGERTVDESTGNLQFRYNGVCYVTDPSGRVGVTSWVESTATRPAMVTLMICSGKHTKTEFAPRNPAAAKAAATKLLLREVEGDSAPPFHLLSMESYEPMAADGAAPGEQLVIMLLGPFEHISPLVNPTVAWPPTSAKYSLKPETRPQGQPQIPKSWAWKEQKALKFRIPSDIFSLAMRASLGASINPATKEQQDAPHDEVAEVILKANRVRSNAAALEHMAPADAKLMRVYHALEEEGRLAELTQIGGMISQLDYIEKEVKKSDRQHGRAHNPHRQAIMGPESYADLATGLRDAIENYDLAWKRPGRAATLAELKGRPELNDTTCELMKFDAAAGRWRVRLASGEAIRIKSENLHPFQAKPKAYADRRM